MSAFNPLKVTWHLALVMIVGAFGIAVDLIAVLSYGLYGGTMAPKLVLYSIPVFLALFAVAGLATLVCMLISEYRR